MKRDTVAVAAIAAALAAMVWVLSSTITGKDEPWDAETPYYFAGLVLAGAASGFIAPKPLWAHYAGAVLGQVVYELVFIKIGPLFILGLVFLAMYSAIFVGAAAAAAAIRQARSRRGAP